MHALYTLLRHASASKARVVKAFQWFENVTARGLQVIGIGVETAAPNHSLGTRRDGCTVNARRCVVLLPIERPFPHIAGQVGVPPLAISFRQLANRHDSGVAAHFIICIRTIYRSRLSRGRPWVHTLLGTACCRVVPFGLAGQKSTIPNSECSSLEPRFAYDGMAFVPTDLVGPCLELRVAG
jgi:hypothetical protein